MTSIVVAMPEREEDRARIRAVMTHPLPSKYPNAVVLPCGRCAMPLSVGPRSHAAVQAGVPLRCPLCLRFEIDPDTVDVLDLGNPQSGWEK